MTFSLKGLKTITNYQYEPACGILSLLDISFVFLLFHSGEKDTESNINQDYTFIQLSCKSIVSVQYRINFVHFDFKFMFGKHYHIRWFDISRKTYPFHE